MSGDSPPELHELEAVVMAEAWRRGEGSVRDVRETLNRDRKRPWAYTTILTVMQRLHKKGLLRRERRGAKHVYIPTLSHDEYVAARAQAQVEALVSEYGHVALAHFSRQISLLDPKEREQIRRLARRA